MKFKNRLIVSFFIIIFVPVVLFGALMLGLKGMVLDATDEQIVSSEVMQSMKDYMQETEKFDEMIKDFCVSEFVILRREEQRREGTRRRPRME